MNFFFQPEIEHGRLYLEADESKHCLKVLRKKRGELVDVLDGKGNRYQCLITSDDIQKLTFEIQSKTTITRPSYSIHIAIAPTKNQDRIEWFIEKCTEIGIDVISFIQCKNSERKKLNFKRLKRKSVEALKQSGNLFLPQINPIESFNEFIKNAQEKNLYMAHKDDQNNDLAGVAPKRGSYLVLIGPEGDFTEDEISIATKHGYKKVTLSESRLRTETAGLVACHTLHVINRI